MKQDTGQTPFQRMTEAARHFWDRSVAGATNAEATSGAGAEPTPAPGDEVARLHGLHRILKYDQYDEKTGLFYNDDSVAFCYEVIPQTGADEDMATRLTTLFTPIPPNTGVQWCLFGSPILDDQYAAYLNQRHHAVETGNAPAFFLELAKRRIAFLSTKKGRGLWPNENYVVKRIRLLVSITRAGSHRDHKLVEEMAELRETLWTSLRTACLPAYALDAEGLIQFVWPILNPESLFDDAAFPAVHYDNGKSIKEQLTRYGHHARVRTDEILFGLPPDGAADEDQRVAMRGFGVLQYPKKKELWEMANIIGSFFDDGLQYPCPFLVCGGVFTLDPNVVDTKAQLKGARSKQNAKSRMAEFQPQLVQQAADWDTVIHQLNNGGSMCELYHTLLLLAPRNLINKVSQVAVNIWRSERFMIAPLGFLQLSALYASLPMTLTPHLRDDLRTMRIMSSKTTVNAVDMTPAIGEWQGAGDPVMMFFGRRGTPTFLDFYSNTQGNYNFFIAGVSGSGKSVTMNEIVSAYRGTGARVWVIDVGRSYQNLIGLQKGLFLEFTPTTKLCINPFTWVGSDGDTEFKDEMRMLKPMIGRMASPDAALSGFQYALLDEAITATWADYGTDNNPTHIRDYLLAKIKNERGGVERVSYELAKQLQPFTQDGIYGGFFNGRANISLDADMVGLELEELKNAPDLRRVVLFGLTNRIAHDMYLSRDSRKLCLIDEAWQLLGDDKETADFIEEGYRRGRKYNGIFGVGTQGIEDAYKNAASQAAYNNSDWKIFLRQDRKNLQKLIDDGTVNFSAAVKRMLLSLRTEKGRFSEMLISSPNGDAVVRHIPDPFSLLMASTNAADFTECEALLKQGYSTMQTLEIMLERRGQR